MNRPSFLDPLSLFVPDVPAASPADPATSHQAAAEITKSGRRGRHCEIVLRIVRQFPGMTGYEIADRTTEDEKKELKTVHEVYRRLNDLRAAGLVRQGPARVCDVRGRMCVTWKNIE